MNIEPPIAKISGFKGDTSHWAYKQGHTEGLTRDTAKRGLMVFGFNCAATSLDASKARQWIAGFDEAIKTSPAITQAPPSSYPSEGNRYSALGPRIS